MNWLTAVTVVTVLLQLTNMWFLSKGTIVYPIMLIVYAGYMAIETYLAVSDPSQWSIMLFNIVNVWAVAMALKGARAKGWISRS